MAAARIMRALHSKVASSDQNPAYLVTKELNRRFMELQPEERTEENIKKIVDEELAHVRNENPKFWPLQALGCQKVHAQSSDVRRPSPFDMGDRPLDIPMFYATTYLGYHRITVSVG